MQSVDVLRDHAGQEPALLELGEASVTGVGPRARKAIPADERACPVAAPHGGVSQKIAVLDGAPGSRSCAGTPVVRDAALGADACSGERDESAASEDLRELPDARVGRLGR